MFIFLPAMDNNVNKFLSNAFNINYKEVLQSRKSKWNEYLDEPTLMSDEEEHSPTEALNNVHLPDRHSITKKRKISDVDNGGLCNFEYNEFPKSIHSLKNSLYQSSVQQESIYNSFDLNSFVETSEDNYLSSKKMMKDENLLMSKSGLHLKSQQSNYLGSKNAVHKSSCSTLSFNRTSSNKCANVDKINTWSEMLLTSDHNNMQEELGTKVTNHGSNVVLGQEAAPEKKMTKRPAESIFEQDCDLSDSEFQLEF